MVVRYKARWFKREIDPSLDIDEVAPPSSRAQQQASSVDARGGEATPTPTPAGQTSHSSRSANATNSTNAQPSSSSNTTTKTKTTATAARDQQPSNKVHGRPPTTSLVLGTVLVLGHLVLIFSCLAIIQPFNMVLSHIGQTYFVRSSLLVHGVRLSRKVGRPSSFTSFAALTPWIQKVSSTTEAFYLMTTILLASNPSAWMGFLSMAILAVYHVSSGLSSILYGRGALLWKRAGGESMHRWLSVHQQDALQIMALMEVGAGFQIGLSALRYGPRALMTTWVYVNQLRLRYWSPESRAYHVKAWEKLGNFVDPVLRNFPISQRLVAAGKRWFDAAGRR